MEANIFPTITTRTGDADIDLIVEYEIQIPAIPTRGNDGGGIRGGDMPYDKLFKLGTQLLFGRDI